MLALSSLHVCHHTIGMWHLRALGCAAMAPMLRTSLFCELFTSSMAPWLSSPCHTRSCHTRVVTHLAFNNWSDSSGLISPNSLPICCRQSHTLARMCLVQMSPCSGTHPGLRVLWTLPPMQMVLQQVGLIIFDAIVSLSRGQQQLHECNRISSTFELLLTMEMKVADVP